MSAAGARTSASADRMNTWRPTGHRGSHVRFVMGPIASFQAMADPSVLPTLRAFILDGIQKAQWDITFR
ncbi:hypothetical protein CJO79_16505 (plasmid) [Ralstonia solanacearum]|nr:hypothetical protein CJO76_16525 [Ralstonia solanacearum]AXV92651.1 hypothetical protein CJO79_16505 [Ralstonia solanacearum]AXW77548.1 hypothetical protein CJO97_16500 [Ralstonia solanacearum]